MARNTVMKLWNVLVTAFLALFTALGLVTTTAAAAVPQTETTRNSAGERTAPATAPTTLSPWSWSHARSLPPTMKQRIHAEAHGKSPSCRHLPLDDAEPAPAECSPATSAPSAPVAEAPLQR
ncbi:DUF6344 domain-containing protein [Streptomyces sp. NPDC006610]|jgi:hypothetical protein|uniref:DUF6344 domain-containing protein n=1 Tax=Streptomyces sp. NPDC006610 TaxID=3154584 RepID=UPI0033A3453A